MDATNETLPSMASKLTTDTRGEATMNVKLRSLQQKALVMQDKLIQRIPDLVHFFVNIPFAEENLVIPFLPIRCFRMFDIFSGEIPASGRMSDVFSFLSSGSTNDVRGKHYFSETGLECYAQASVVGLKRFLERFGFSYDVPILSLVPTPALWTSSSLAAMIDMFSGCGFRIEYCNVDCDIGELISKLSQVGEEAIVFGTSFHHVWVQRLAQQNSVANIFSGKRLGIVDTGGTKGRTEVFSQQDILNFSRSVYGESVEICFLSEYGMCELASQAWALENPHKNLFACNQTLFPFVLDAGFQRFVDTGDVGFLAFGDAINTDSYPFVITEDLGKVHPSIVEHGDTLGVFSIEGRAPDASLKGCSLNVRQAPLASSSSSSSSYRSSHRASLDSSGQSSRSVLQRLGFARFSMAKAFEGDIFSRVRFNLGQSGWSEADLVGLQSAMRGWNELSKGSLARFRNSSRERVAHVVASANIPITWLLPAVAAAWMGFRDFHINLPTLRGDDPFSEGIISQIQSLVECCSIELAPMKIHLHTRRLAHPDEFGADILLVFGSDATCRVFREMQPHYHSRILTFGDVWNSMDCGTLSSENVANIASETAQICASWRGRGCLTPIVLFLDSVGAQSDSCVKKQFAADLSSKLSTCFSLYDNTNDSLFLHATDMMEVKARLAGQGFNSVDCVFQNPGAWIVDASQLNCPWELPLRSGGSGLVFLLDSDKKKSAELSWLSTYNTRPIITDAHMGKTWFDWLSLYFKS